MFLFMNKNICLFFSTILVANNVKPLSKEAAPTYTVTDITNIKRFSRQKNVVSSIRVIKFLIEIYLCKSDHFGIFIIICLIFILLASWQHGCGVNS